MKPVSSAMARSVQKRQAEALVQQALDTAACASKASLSAFAAVS